MKKTTRFAIILISIAIVVTAIGFWRHHYLKIMNADPVNVYKDTPIEPDIPPKKTIAKNGKVDKGTPSQQETSPQDTYVEGDDIRDVEPEVTTQPINNSPTPKETDNTGNQTVHHIFSDIIVENLPPKAAAALKDYEEVQLAIPELNEKLMPLLEASPIDFDAIGVINDKKDVLNERRMNALEVLSKYSKQAADKLQAAIKRGKAAEKVVEEYEENPDMSTEDIIRRVEELTK